MLLFLEDLFFDFFIGFKVGVTERERQRQKEVLHPLVWSPSGHKILIPHILITIFSEVFL